MPRGPLPFLGQRAANEERTVIKASPPPPRGKRPVALFKSRPSVVPPFKAFEPCQGCLRTGRLSGRERGNGDNGEEAGEQGIKVHPRCQTSCLADGEVRSREGKGNHSWFWKGEKETQLCFLECAPPVVVPVLWWCDSFSLAVRGSDALIQPGALCGSARQHHPSCGYSCVCSCLQRGERGRGEGRDPNPYSGALSFPTGQEDWSTTDCLLAYG